MYDFEVCDLLTIFEGDHCLLLDSFLASDPELGIVEFLSSMKDIHLLHLDTIERLECIFHIDLCGCRIDHTGIDTTYFTVGRLIGDDETFDDGVERVHKVVIRGIVGVIRWWRHVLFPGTILPATNPLFRKMFIEVLE